MVIMYWVSHCHLPVDQELLSRMRNFCEGAIGVKTSSIMAKKASKLLQMIDERVGRFIVLLLIYFLNLISQSRKDLMISPALSPSRKLLQDSDIAPDQLAIALTLLEGDKYKAIVPSDYITHLGKHPGSNGVKVACSVNNKIVLWVKQSVLHYDTAQSRARRLEFFLNTAQVSRLTRELYIQPADQITRQECRKLRNYGSLIAIGIALHSAPIKHLKLTKENLSSRMSRNLKELKDIFNPSSNHRGYHKVLNQVVDQKMRNYCVPWLGEDCFVDFEYWTYSEIHLLQAVHLEDLHSVLTHNPIEVKVDGRPLINFQRYIKFMDKIKEILHYKPPNLEQYRQQGYLAYLENQLQCVCNEENTDDELMKKSIELRKGEVLEIKRRLTGVGFKVKP